VETPHFDLRGKFRLFSSRNNNNNNINNNNYYYYYYLIELQMAFYPVTVVLKYDTTEKYTYHTKWHTTLKQNTAHEATQTLKDNNFLG
jgi:hypothetical protein